MFQDNRSEDLAHNQKEQKMDGMSDVARSCRLHLNVPEQAETPRRELQHSAFRIVHSMSNGLPDKGRSRVARLPRCGSSLD
jgi:hypothetical protein